MIIARPRNWRLVFSAAGILFSLGSCSSESILAELPVDDERGAIAGELVVYVANFDDGTAETRYFLKQRDGAERRLHFKVEPNVAARAHLNVWGIGRADRIDVTRYKLVEGPLAGDGDELEAPPLIDAALRLPRVMCVALVHVNRGTGHSTLPTIKARFHTGPASANAYYVENSFGQVSLPGDAYGPFEFSMTTCDHRGLAAALRPMINALANTTCHQYAFVMEPRVDTCDWAGLAATGGTSDRPTRDSWYNDSTRCVDVVQGPGQNYGMQHSSSITCAGGAFTDDLSGCVHDEYGDEYDAMGSGCYHLNAWQKLYQKWFGGCNGVRTTSSGKFNLYPIEAPCDGVQVLQVPFPDGRTRSFQNTTLTSYYLELRSNIGFDSDIMPQVMLRAGGAPTLPTSINSKGLHTWLINAGSPGMTAGQTFTDPAGGLTITVDLVDATHAVVDINYAVEMGTPVCLDGSNAPFTPPGPSACTNPRTTGDAGPPSQPDATPDTGEGGSSGSGGNGGVSGGGNAGDSGNGGTAGTSPPAPEANDGCGCELAKMGPSKRLPVIRLFTLGFGGVLATRRRRAGPNAAKAAVRPRMTKTWEFPARDGARHEASPGCGGHRPLLQ
jgi:hypothetical protein